MHLLIVEDHRPVRQLVVKELEAQGVRVTAVGTLADGHTALSSETFDVAILDLHLPDGSGLDLLRTMRERTPDTHVIILSGAGSEGDRVRALQAGADDYVVKPFFARELTARVLAVNRRCDAAREGHLLYGPLCIDVAARSVTLDGATVELTPKEFDLLAFVAARPHQTFTRDDLLRSVWQSAPDWQQASTVTEHVRRLRLKLERPGAPPLLRTVRGVGYRFDPPAEDG